MYETRFSGKSSGAAFDWTTYFSQPSSDLVRRLNHEEIVRSIREHLKEDRSSLALAHGGMLRPLLKGYELDNIRVLELGAGTGFLTRWLLDTYGGTGVLVDNNEAAERAFFAIKDGLGDRIEYRLEDLFSFDTSDRFDVVCSNGVVEHYPQKKAILNRHSRFLNETGIIVILVPMDSKLSRTFYEAFPELNLGYRELWTRSDFHRIMGEHGLEIGALETSRGYCFDFGGVVCKPKKS